VPERPSQTVVIVTALDGETRAVLRQLGRYEEEVVQGTVFFVGTFEDSRVAVVEVGPGNVAVAAIADRAIGHFKADIAIFVGVGGGVKDVALGDVVVASKVYGYEGGKDKANAFLPRPDLHRSAHGLEQRARAMAKRKNWHARLDKALGLESPNLLVAPIAAGEKVVASTRSPTAGFLKKQYSDAVAVEMEGRGFLEAVHINSVLGTVIRGISDQLSGKSVSDKAGWQRKAADAASAVAFEMLATLTPKPPATVAAPAAPARYGDGAAFVEMPATLNEASFFREGEVLARVGVPEVDEVQFAFRKLPDSYIRIIPKRALNTPITTAHLNNVADLAPLLKHRQFGGFKFVNRLGAMVYDPGGPHRGGPAPLSWATQLFSNGELWLVSNTMIVRERGGRPQWIPVPFVPATLFESIFYDKVRVAIAFAVQHLGLTFPCAIEMGLLGTADVTLAINQEDTRVIRNEKIVLRQDLADAAGTNIDAALLSFFNAIYDATGHARPEGLFGFPPNSPKP
jgi:nucleoside phosphorylase